ncbi:MAG: outer membrane beta-barrel family protein, partial [Muribaculaceae bacterium]|nr:outer membrane beta-barrel family protein [Muribaculaceae bacterium]
QLYITIEEKKGYTFRLGYSINSSNAPMQNMITLPQTDPMNVYYGNPDLKPSLLYNVNFNLERMMSGQKSHTVSIHLSSTDNGIARGYIFNTLTGVRYYYPFNIDGNRNGMINYMFFTPFGKDNRFDISTSTTFSISKNVDMIGTTVETQDFVFNPDDQERRNIHTISAREHLNLRYTFAQNTVSAFGNINLYNYRSDDPGFTNFHSITGRYGVSGTFSLPLGINLSTDFNVFSRNGFTDDKLNTSDLIWNAQLSKPFLKGSIILSITGFDMLHQLNNILYTVTPQARTEIVRNVVPAKVLFKIQYRINKSPKR